MEMKEYPEKSWSTSRMNILKECPRSYYYNYYLAHNGWFKDAEPIRRKVYKLKKLTNIYMVKGSALHEQAKIAIEEIKDGKEVAYKTENDMRNAVVNKLKEAVVESISNLSSGKFNSTCKGMMLQEYYYGGSISKENGDKIKEDVKVCIDNLFICKTFDRLSSLTTVKIIEIDETGFDNCLFIDGVKLYFKVDLIYEEENGEVWVVDWKTGKYSEDDK
ncbi:PD-(D/E)XK nuclease family protein [uncultured Clostridium sp.]|uniref:PD-(D/E)XK nuclease family protein n=1 Tax=uncultured Clostridium sp. TaxID=59620 RepID=UPI002607E047|nr:PD-(D/E)XK nuclease family protein [uncultured Clostridium sp.]